MPDRKHDSLPFESGNASEQRLWAALGDLPREEPPTGLRQAFYARLEHAEASGWRTRIKRLFLVGGHPGWLTAAACLLLGFGIARTLDGTAPDANPRLVALEQNVAVLHRELLLDRMQDTTVATRLQGVAAAGRLAASDAEIVQALLRRATQDRALSVRAAAIEALAPQLATETIGGQLMALLENVESPIVQLALVDLVLRHGSHEQLRTLASVANAGRLHPDLARHVQNSIRSETI